MIPIGLNFQGDGGLHETKKSFLFSLETSTVPEQETSPVAECSFLEVYLIKINIYCTVYKA